MAFWPHRVETQMCHTYTLRVGPQEACSNAWVPVQVVVWSRVFCYLLGSSVFFFFLSFWRKLQEQCLCSSAERGVVEVACVLGSSPHSRCSRDAGDLQELVSLGPLLWYRSEYRILCCCRLKLTLSFYLKQLCIFEKCNYQE